MSCKCGRMFCRGCGKCERPFRLCNLPKIDPVIPKYEPIKFDFPKIDPLIPTYDPIKFDLPKIDPVIPKYEPIKLNLPKADPMIPKYDPLKFEQPKISSYDDRNEWNRLYGYHHTLGPAFGPKFMP